MIRYLTVLFLFAPVLLFAQSPNLEELKLIHEVENAKRLARVQEYSNKYNEPVLRQLESGVTIYLEDVVNGKPQYLIAHNAGARVSTGAKVIGLDGSMGLDLDGAGISVAIWDEGLARSSHVELDGRVTPADDGGGVGFGNHATHVMGTILSRGLNSAAMGMAVNATAKSFDFFSAYGEMLSLAEPDQSGIILSNHSYGPASGWEDGSWFGDATISELEDYKFGIYDNRAVSWDALIYASPYYTIVKSAGNDRGNSGNGSHPVDGPFDIISTPGTAKNIITIGAVNKLGVYTQPSDIVMSSFSSWGPTDDGRIKPDFVAAGVDILSTIASEDDAYASFSGTSMSAPNATGTFILLQQLHKKLNGGNLMKASKLKGLVAHTAHEASIHDGPDYSYGWGLINAAGAADLLIKDDTEGVLIEEFRLIDGESFSMSFDSNIGAPVKATICWTDPPGTASAPSLDPIDLKLVNDLDMRISSTGDNYLPWILNPEFPQVAASKGDNFRDNIEVIEFVPTENSHDLIISHKGTLTNGFQDFTLILTYEPQSSISSLRYWVGDDNSPNVAANWSSESGGSGGAQLPNSETTVIFDNNSFTTEGPFTAQMTSDFVCKNFIYLSDKELILDIGSNEFKVTGKLTTNDNISFVGNGNIVFDSDLQDVTIAGSTSLKDMSVVFANELGSWIVAGDLTIGQLDLQAGQIDFNSNTVTVSNFVSTSVSSKEIILSNSHLKVLESADFSGSNLTLITENSIPTSEGAAVTIQGPNQAFNGSIFTTNETEVSGFTEVETLDVTGTLTLASDITINEFVSGAESALILSGSRLLEIVDLTINNGEKFFTMSSPDGLSEIIMNGHRRICYDYFDISNINLTGEAAVSIGANSIVTDALGWVAAPCEDVLFSDFSFTYNCENSMVQFSNESLGNFTTVEWSFGGQGNSTELNPSFIFSGSGTFPVTLTVFNSSYSKDYTKDVALLDNELIKSDVSIVGEVLLSSATAESYQWYNNGEIIEGATDRFYEYNEEEGNYSVVLYSEQCNLPSNSLEIIVSSITSELPGFNIYPNPAHDEVIVENRNRQELKIEILSVNGQVFNSIEGNDQKLKLDVSRISPGLYFLRVYSPTETILRRIIVQ